MEYSDEMQFLAEQEFRILTDFMHALCAMEGVANAVLVTYSGEYMT